MESEVWLEEAGHQVGDHKEPNHCRPRSMELTYGTLPPLQPRGEMHAPLRSCIPRCLAAGTKQLLGTEHLK